MSGKKPLRVRMDTKPPPPPNTSGQSQPRMKSARRPKTPPPRRPPRPVVKQKEDSAHIRSTSDTVMMVKCTDADSIPVVDWADCAVSDRRHGNALDQDTSSNHSNQNNCNLNNTSDIVTPPNKVKKSVSINSPVTGDTKSVGNHSNRAVVRVPLNRNKRKAPDVPRTSKLTGHGDVGLSSHKQPVVLVTKDGVRGHSKSFSPADFSGSKGSAQHLDTLRLRKGSLDDDVLTRSKPVIQYVKVVRKDRGTDPITIPCQMPHKSQSRSMDELDRYDIFLDLSDISCDYFYDQAFRSSFLEEATLKRQTIGFHSDVQTLLKHSHKETEHIYSLPQPASYSDSTLKAVKLITEKYDTLQRRRLHAASFREGDLAKLRGTLTLHRELSNKSNKSDQQDNGTSPSKSLPSSPILRSPVSSPVSNPVLRSIVKEEQDAEDIVCGVTGLSKRDTRRLEMFYRGRDTEVIVCSCLSDLYLGSSAGPSAEVSNWRLYYSGVPIWVLNTGEGQRNRELHLYLAERDTGFPLWKDKINYLTNLEVMPGNPNVFSLRLSGSLSKMAKFSVFCVEAAMKFCEQFVTMTVDPNDELWRVSSESTKESRKAQKKKRKKWKSFTIHDISQPCNFEHIHRVDPCDPKALASVSVILESNQDTYIDRAKSSSLNTSLTGHHTKHSTA